MNESKTHTDFSADLREAVEVLRKGGIILYPTDTVWGLGCDATNAEAVARIYALKRRAESKSMLVLVSGEAMLERFVAEVPDIAWQLLEASVRPLTIIYDGAQGLASNLVAEDGSIGVRVTHEAFSRELAARLRRPIVSTSANISGSPAPRTFSEITEDVKAGVDFIPQYRREDTAPANPSDIIRLKADGEFKIIR